LEEQLRPRWQQGKATLPISPIFELLGSFGRLRLQPDLDQPADGFGTAGDILLPSPVVYPLSYFGLSVDSDENAGHGGPRL